MHIRMQVYNWYISEETGLLSLKYSFKRQKFFSFCSFHFWKKSKVIFSRVKT